MTHQRRQQWLWIAVIPFLLLTCWLGTRSQHPFWGDEVYTIRDARGFDDTPYTLPQIWNEVALNNPDHAPGYFMLLNLWAQLTSWQPQTLRFLSLLVSLLGIAITYRVGRQWLSAEAGLTAAIILAVSPFYIFFYTQARVYALTGLLSVATLALYLQIVNRPKAPSRGLWLLFFALIVLTLYSHYLAGITLVGIGVYHLLFVPKNRRWWIVVAVGIAGGLAFVPWVWVLLRSLHPQDLSELSFRDALTGSMRMFSNGMNPLLLGLLLVALIALRSGSRHARANRQIVVISLVSLVALLAANEAIGFLSLSRLRYLLPLWPLFALVVGLGAAVLRRPRGLMIGLLALWIFGGLWNTLRVNFTKSLDGSSYDFPVDQVATALRNHVETNDLIVSYPPDNMELTVATTRGFIFRYYYQLLAHLPVSYTIFYQRSTAAKRADIETRLTQAINGQPRIWIAYTRRKVPSALDHLESLLTDRGYQPCAINLDAAAPLAAFELYVAQGVSCPTDTSSN